jgi:hypothetical protein
MLDKQILNNQKIDKEALKKSMKDKKKAQKDNELIKK